MPITTEQRTAMHARMVASHPHGAEVVEVREHFAGAYTGTYSTAEVKDNIREAQRYCGGATSEWNGGKGVNFYGFSVLKFKRTGKSTWVKDGDL
jgi:hypothetical protein